MVGIGLQIPARSYYANRIQREFLPRYIVPLNRLQELTGPHQHAAILKLKATPLRGLSRWCSSIAPPYPGTLLDSLETAGPESALITTSSVPRRLMEA